MADDLQEAWTPLYEWRCPSCIFAPLFGHYSSLGGLHTRASGRTASPSHHVHNLVSGSSVAHCGSCHDWRELYYDHTAHTVRERKWTGYQPFIGCGCQRDDPRRGAVRIEPRERRPSTG